VEDLGRQGIVAALHTSRCSSSQGSTLEKVATVPLSPGPLPSPLEQAQQQMLRFSHSILGGLARGSSLPV